MEWYNRYKKQLAYVFNEAEQRIAAFPAPLDSIGLAYADKFNPTKQDSGKDYICCLLPFWVKESAGINDDQCERLALANVYGMLYFFIQDDIMDSKPSSNWKERLALGNLLMLEMFNIFRKLFPSSSAFWEHYDSYVLDWADSVVNENSEDFFIKDPIRTAGKASPVKTASTGALLLSGREALIPSLEHAIDIVLMTLQMADDYADWKEDLADGSYNGLLAMIAADRDNTEPLTEKEVENAIYIRGCMKPYTQIAQDNHKKLLATRVGANELIQFHAYIIGHLIDVAETIESNLALHLKGGFEYFLSTNPVKQVL
ncbi:hypothetical protein FHS15_003767 [Paenibacillus castaneae]|uniref:hypothetical protein n=1 Tax=Paenibacillus castaneae TaxID=474957 RepID=UPI000C9C03A6|nr:hypothetical protein [Paenibacillus castaneae]NIK78621.1 hypothetical protein [Paenibacillus castaneae]